MNKDWRADLSDCSNLYDIDPLSNMIFLRHQYLETAKDLLKNQEDWDGMGQASIKVAEHIQEAIEEQVKDVLDLETFHL